jgi:hypothetical protein
MSIFSSDSKGRIALVVTVMALVALACVCGGAPAVVPTVAVPTVAVPTVALPTTAPTEAPSTTGGDTGGTSGVDLKVVNQTTSDICYLYVTDSESDDWGPEQLGTDQTIVAGSDFTITDIPTGTYDLETEDCDHNVISWNYNVELSEDNTLTVSGAPDQLAVENTSSQQLCGLYISPPTEENWGRSHLNPEHPIEPGTTRTFAITSGTWDLRVETCDGTSIDRTGQEFTGGTFTWTISD